MTLKQRRPCPEEDAHFLSWITWWWQTRQFWNGWRQPLKYDDLADLNSKDKSGVIASRLLKNWDRELKKAGLVVYDLDYHHPVHSPPLYLFLSSINFTDHHIATRTEETYEFELSDSKSARSADKTTFLPASQHGGQQRRAKRKTKEPSFFMALARSFGGTFFMAGLFKLLQDLLTFVSPLLLK
jgi:hypothetical protein